MSHLGDFMTAGAALLFAGTGGTTVTVTHGSTSISVTNAMKGLVRRSAGREGLDLEEVAWRFLAADVTAATLSPGDTITEDTITEGSVVWEIPAEPESVRYLADRKIVSVRCQRRIQRGAS